MNTQPGWATEPTLFTDCSACQGVGCRDCRPLCPICEQQGRETVANAGGRYCEDHDPATARMPI